MSLPEKKMLFLEFNYWNRGCGMTGASGWLAGVR
jgi:hypothetical protein